MLNDIPPIINRRVAVAMAALCFYGILLIFITNNNIHPSRMFPLLKNTLWNFKKMSDNNDTTKQIVQTKILLNGTVTMATPMTMTSAHTSNTTGKHQQHQHRKDQNRKALITIFTTFRNSMPKEHIYKNTIINYELLKPDVIPIMYHSEGEKELTQFGARHGWHFYPVPKTSKHGVPILRHMFIDAQTKFNSTFYCYSNGDILFDMRFIDTLKVLREMTDKLKKVLIVGQRSNYQLTANQRINSIEEVTELAKNAKLFSTNAEDYFISTRDGYPWETIPDFVVGRIGYDNWLVVTAITKEIVVIDTTKTILALHQTGKDGNFAGKFLTERKNINVNINN